MKNHVLKLFCFFILILGQSVTASSEAPLRIGVSLGLTGRYSDMSEMQMKGYRLWEVETNKRGGIAGRPVEVVIMDDQSDRQVAVAQYEKLISTSKVDFVFGPYSSAITEAVLPVTDRYGYPVLIGGASSDRLWSQGHKNIYGVYTPASRYAVGFLEMLVENGIEQLAILAADDVFSQSTAEGTATWAGRYDLEVVYRQTFKKGKDDLATEVKGARESGAGVLIVCGHLDEAVAGRRALSRTGWEPAAFYATVGPALQKYRQLVGSSAEGTFSSSQWEPDPDLAYPGSREFLVRFTSAYGHKPSYQAATAYAAGTILEKAIARAGSIDRAQVARVLATLDTMSIIGRYGVDGAGMQIRQFPVIIQWQGGRKRIVWPEQIRTAAPVLGRADD